MWLYNEDKNYIGHSVPLWQESNSRSCFGTGSFEPHDRGLTGSCGCHSRQIKVTQVDVSKFLMLTIGVVGRRSKG
jgi:hypothetical protein